MYLNRESKMLENPVYVYSKANKGSHRKHVIDREVNNAFCLNKSSSSPNKYSKPDTCAPNVVCPPFVFIAAAEAEGIPSGLVRLRRRPQIPLATVVCRTSGLRDWKHKF